ncbi:MAG: hypothetical protein IJ306_06730 [Oscillospiraceae bacterium]|nr:hypothetical protein [Oscillospiraceae bacterium]
MIIKVFEKNILDAAAVYMDSWKESHKNICSAEFIEKHDLEYMQNFLLEKLSSAYQIYIKYCGDVPVGIIAINPDDEEICLM